MITVYQADWKRVEPEVLPRVMAGEETAVQMCWERGLYRPVAEVKTRDLDAAYLHTNTIGGVWYLSSDVHPSGQKRSVEMEVSEWALEGCRSTSVGDVMLSDGQYHIVSSYGFAPVNLGELGGVESMTANCRAAYEALCKVDFKALGFPTLSAAIPWGDLRAAAGKEV